MSGLDRIRAKFWAMASERGRRIASLVADARRGDSAAREQIAALVHTMKGEAQLLSLEPTATLLERADRLAKLVVSRELPASAASAFEAVAEALDDLGRTNRTSGRLDSTIRLLDQTFAELGGTTVP